MSNNRINNFQIVPVTLTPVLDTGAYISGDVLFIATIASVLVALGVDQAIRAEVVDLTLIDKSCQKGALDLVFFNSAPTTLGAANAVVALSSAEALLVRKLVSIAATDYVELKATANAIAAKDFAPFTIKVPAGALGFYVAGISRDTKTYGAADLQLTLGVRLHNSELA